MWGDARSEARKLFVCDAPLTDISIGGTCAIAIDANSNVWTWGSNANGQLG